MKRLTAILTAVLLLCSCVKSVRHVEREDWAPDVKTAINDFMDCYAGSYNGYAVFDFDNTTCIFDVENQLVIHQLETMSFNLTPARLPEVLRTICHPENWNLEDWISDITAAYSYLYGTYGPFTPDGLSPADQQKVHSDPMWLEFAAKMGKLYSEVGLNEAPGTATQWVLYWFDGMIHEEIYDLASRSHRKYMALETADSVWRSPAEIPSRIGPVEYSFTNGLSVTPNIKELWECLDENGIDIWVCSASGIDQVMAAVDAAGLHGHISGVIAMNVAMDWSGRATNAYDYSAPAYVPARNGGWVADSTLVVCEPPCLHGKVAAIDNTLVKKYGTGPLACFMDATGDFYFCTEYASTRLVTCFNRADRPVSEGGGLIAELAIHQRDVLGYDLRKANAAGDTFYVLQGRDENGMRSLRPSNATLRAGSNKERLFLDERNSLQLELMKSRNMSTAEALSAFTLRTSVPNALGFDFGFADSYEGYHSK